VVPAPLRPVAKRAYHRALPASRRRAIQAADFRAQGHWCSRLGAPAYGALLERAARDVAEGGPCWALLADRPPPPPGVDEALPARLMAGVHRLVLEGRLPELAALHPYAPDGPRSDPWPLFRAAVDAHAPRLRAALEQPVQTNEVSRCSALLGGFLTVARDTGLPLRLLEPGASAGLNLRWPEYRYEEEAGAWGDPSSPVRLRGALRSGSPPLHVPVRVAERRGCDLEPRDPADPEDRLTLMSFAWPEERWRTELLRGAMEVAARTPVTVDRADACGWLEDRLAEPAGGVATVVFHSIFRMYLSEADKERFDRAVAEAGRRATAGAPLAWLRMEWDFDVVLLHLTRWPGGETRLLARTDHRGREIAWVAG
jgi:hypothetical protein